MRQCASKCVKFACNTLSGTRGTVRDQVCNACKQHKAHQFPSFHHPPVSLALTRPKHEAVLVT